MTTASITKASATQATGYARLFVIADGLVEQISHREYGVNDVSLNLTDSEFIPDSITMQIDGSLTTAALRDLLLDLGAESVEDKQYADLTDVRGRLDGQNVTVKLYARDAGLS